MSEGRNPGAVPGDGSTSAPDGRRRISHRLHIDEYVLTVLRPHDSDPVDTDRRDDRHGTVAPRLHNPYDRRWKVIDGRGPHPDLARHRAAGLPTDAEIQPTDLRPNRIRWRLARRPTSGQPAVDIAVNLHWQFGALHRGVAFVHRAWVDVPVCSLGEHVAIDLLVEFLPPRVVGSTAVLPVRLDGAVANPGGIEAFDWRLALRGDGSTTAWTSSAR